jgi:hypothetical protein
VKKLTEEWENYLSEGNLHSLFTNTRGCPRLPLPYNPAHKTVYIQKRTALVVNDVNARGATRFTSIGSGKCKYSDHDGSSDDERPSPSKVFGARQSTVTGLTGDSSDKVNDCNVIIDNMSLTMQTASRALS